MVVFELTVMDYGVMALCAMLVGFTKTGIPGILILVVPLMAGVMPARNSVGVLLGLLILADIFAVFYYRHQALWRHVFRLLPVSVVGIIVGYFGLRALDDEQLKPVIGIIVLVLLGVNYLHTRFRTGDDSVPSKWWFAAGTGFMAGVMTMMANAAGPIMIVYLLAMRLGKIQFVGTSAVYFLIVNWIKVPFSASLNLMTFDTVKLNLFLLPCIIIGAVAGIIVLKRIPLKMFQLVVQILAAFAALKLLFF
jgi:uncharacterized membrane protein YfcA